MRISYKDTSWDSMMYDAFCTSYSWPKTPKKSGSFDMPNSEVVSHLYDNKKTKNEHDKK